MLPKSNVGVTLYKVVDELPLVPRWILRVDSLAFGSMPVARESWVILHQVPSQNLTSVGFHAIHFDQSRQALPLDGCFTTAPRLDWLDVQVQGPFLGGIGLKLLVCPTHRSWFESTPLSFVVLFD
jgi:hypothetical protein